ncbi:MAG: CxxC-x17-CxxC domain-containing protein [Patescibacteria group bacterium]|jgi:CxxC-x17-CxxC domain-containing protein
MDDQNQFGQRQMFQGHWTCSECGAEITELPFEPDGDRPIFCRDCHRKKRQSRPPRRRF